MKLVSASPL